MLKLKTQYGERTGTEEEDKEAEPDPSLPEQLKVECFKAFEHNRKVCAVLDDVAKKLPKKIAELQELQEGGVDSTADGASVEGGAPEKLQETQKRMDKMQIETADWKDKYRCEDLEKTVKKY